MRVVLSRSAEADLESIGDYIAHDNARRAVSFVREIRERCQSLGAFPNAAPFVARYESSGVRKLVHENYLIFYRIEEQSAQILRILHGAMDFERILFPEAEGGA